MFVPTAVALAAAFWTIVLVALAVEKHVFDQALRLWKSLSKFNKCVVAVILFGVVAFAGTKPLPGGGDGGDDPSGTNVVEVVEGGASTNLVEDVGSQGEGGAEVKVRGEGEQWNLSTCSVEQSEKESNFLCSPSPLIFTSDPQPPDGRLPVGAILATNWWRRGCWEDSRKVEFADGWVFPFGSNHLSSVAVMSQGEVRTGFCNAPEIAALGTKVALVPFNSCFCHERTPSNSYRFAWNRAYVNRDTNTPMTASIELFRNGNVCVTTNGVPTVEPYVIPFPHVGVGQNDEWVRTNFLNAAEILSAGYAEWVDEQVGVGLDNGLYKFTATFLDDPPEAMELFVGDLSVCVTNAGEYVFLLEKGVEYSFGTNPFDATVDYSMQDDLVPPAPLFASWWGGDDDNGVWTVDGGESRLYWPTLFGYGTCLWEPTFFGSPDVMHIGLDGRSSFEAVLEDYPYPEWASYEWSSDDENIVIGSPYSRETHVWFYDMPSWRSSSLRVVATVGTNTMESVLNFTYGRNSEPQVYPALISPNVVVKDGKRRKLQVDFSSDRKEDAGTLRLTCTQGRDKIALWSAETGGTPVDFERSWSCRSFSGFECYIAGTNTSESVDDVVFSLTYIPEPGGDSTTESGRVTVVDYVCEPISSIKCPVLPGRPYMNPCAIQPGRPEAFWAILLPTNAPASWLSWRAKEGQASFPNGNVGQMVLVDSSSSTLLLETLIYGYDDEPDPIEFKVDVVQAEE